MTVCRRVSDFRINQHVDGWWIEPAEAITSERIGPYATRRAAVEKRKMRRRSND